MARIDPPHRSLGSQTYKGYLLVAASELGHRQENDAGEQTLPTGAELAECRRVVSLALKDWAGLNHRGWRVLRRVARITLAPQGDGPLSVAGHPGVYRMPRDFNGVGSAYWQLGKDSDEAVRGSIPVVFPAEFDHVALEPNATSTIPSYATFRRVSASDSEAKGDAFWTVEFWPRPSSAYTVTMGYEAWVEGMSLDEQVFQPGPAYDRSLEEQVKYRAACEARKPQDILDSRRNARDEALAAALELDRRAAPVNLGSWPGGDPEDSMYEPDDPKTIVMHAIGSD